MQCLAKLPGVHWHPPAPHLYAVGLCLLGLCWLVAPRGVPVRWQGLCLVLPLCWPPESRPAAGGISVYALDVGQGLAVLIETQRHSLLFDAGPRYPTGYDLGAAVVVPAIYSLGAAPLDRIVISHGDNDHAGGADAVVQAFPQAQRLAGEPARMHYPTPPCQRGQHWQWDGVAFRVLWPPPGSQSWPTGNAHSCVLWIQGVGSGVLLTGDIGQAQERALSGTAKLVGPVLLQVPHHGSRSASSAQFLAWLQPKLGWVAAGWRNPFGHPHPEVLRRYQQLGVPLWLTADSGAIEFELPPVGAPHLRRRWRLQSRRYWRE